MRVGAARMTAGLDRMGAASSAWPRTASLRPAAQAVGGAADSDGLPGDLRGQGGAAFPFARKLRWSIERHGKTDQPTMVVNATEGEPGSFKDQDADDQVGRYLVLSGAALVAEAIEAEEIIVGVTGNELANRSIEAAIAAEPGLRLMVRVRPAARPVHLRRVGRAVRRHRRQEAASPGRKTARLRQGRGRPADPAVQRLDVRSGRGARTVWPRRFAAVGVPEEPGTVLFSVERLGQAPGGR